MKTQKSVVKILKQKHPELSLSKLKTIVKDYAGILTNELLTEEETKLPGIGKLKIVQSTGMRKARNISTGEELLIGPRKRVRFSVSSNLNNTVKNK